MDLPIVLKRPSDLPFLAPHFANEVRELDPFDPVLHTTLDLRLQKLIERHVKSYVEANRQKGINNAVVLLVDHRTLEVKSLIGSSDFFDQKIDGQVNGARAKRSPGSALKPFIYGLGIDQGLLHPLTMLKDAPMSFGAYNPENFDNEFAGPIKAKDALVKSRNVPAVDIASRLTSPGLHGFLLKAGITRMREESFYGMSLALGSAEVSMEELVQLYAMLENGGELKRLKFLKSQKKEEGTRLLSKEASYLVLDILSDNPNPLQGFRTDWIRDHRISINSRTGLRACIDGGLGTRSEVYEFWSSDLIAIFRQAGIPRRMPPPYEPGCRMDVTASRGAGPRITSPRDGVVYSLRAGSLKDERVPFTAVTDADTKTIHWFVSEEYLGSSDSGKAFFWTPKPGRFVVRAVDDLGRTSHREVRTQLVE